MRCEARQLPLELPIRVAEDASVLDILSGGRLEAQFVAPALGWQRAEAAVS